MQSMLCEVSDRRWLIGLLTTVAKGGGWSPVCPMCGVRCTARESTNPSYASALIRGLVKGDGYVSSDIEYRVRRGS